MRDNHSRRNRLALGAVFAIVCGSLSVDVPVAPADQIFAPERVGYNSSPAISGDGRYVAFASADPALVAADTNALPDIFLHDSVTQEMRLVSASASGAHANDWSLNPSISGNGRFVAFASKASNLVPYDSNGDWDVFRKDMVTGDITVISTALGGAQANSSSDQPVLSPDGRYVAFASRASNLVVGDTNLAYDIFRRDTVTGTTVRVSVTESGGEPTANPVFGYAPDSTAPSMSHDGRYIAFSSHADNLVATDRNVASDVFLRDVSAGTTRRVSLAYNNNESGLQSIQPSISGDGRLVAFTAYGQLHPIDGNPRSDIYVRDVIAGTTVLASDTFGESAPNTRPAISGDGRFVAFTSDAALWYQDNNSLPDIYEYEFATGYVRRLTESWAHGPTNGGSDAVALSFDGVVAAFVSAATNVVAGEETLKLPQVYAHKFKDDKKQECSTTRVSKPPRPRPAPYVYCDPGTRTYHIGPFYLVPISFDTRVACSDDPERVGLSEAYDFDYSGLDGGSNLRTTGEATLQADLVRSDRMVALAHHDKGAAFAATHLPADDYFFFSGHGDHILAAGSPFVALWFAERRPDATVKSSYIAPSAEDCLLISEKDCFTPPPSAEKQGSLAVLSACYSARDGLRGSLVEAFKRAGFETVVGFTSCLDNRHDQSRVWAETFWRSFRFGATVEQAAQTASDAVRAPDGSYGGWASWKEQGGIVGNRALKYDF